MTPIPITFTEETLQLISAAKRRQKDLVDFQIPRLQACQGPLSLQQDLAAELREDIQSFARQVERVSQREELLTSSAVIEKANLNEKVTEDALMKANDNVTEALRRTIGWFHWFVPPRIDNKGLADASTASLNATSSTHDTLTNLMGTSKQLITALEKSDWIDRVLILSTFVFFLLVVMFIIKQRIVDRGLRLAFWWTRFLPDYSGDATLLNTEKQYALSASALTTSLASSVLSISATMVASSIPASSTEHPGVDRLEPSISIETSFVTLSPSVPSIVAEHSSDALHHVFDEL
ncbi:hypothetical protein C0993_001938 [Termitomyces sp. T159_Od127]|nr:hypothetical protein C0993_001938 [Termitomyces sp. T159_Od127]